MKAELIQLEERREELNKESAELKNILEDNVPRMRSRINRLAEILQDFHASEEEASQIRADIDGLKNEIDDMRRLGKTREILRSSGFDEVEDLRFVSSGGMLRLTPDLDAVYGLLSRFKTSMGETVEDIDRERLSVDNSIEDKKNELSGVLGESEEQENIGDDTDEAKEVESESKEDPEDNNAEAEQEAEEFEEASEEEPKESTEEDIPNESEMKEQGPGKDIYARLQQIEGTVKFSLNEGTLSERHFEITNHGKLIKIVEKGVGYVENRAWTLREDGLVILDGKGTAKDIDVPEGRLMLKKRVGGGYTKYGEEALNELDFVIEKLIEGEYIK